MTEDVIDLRETVRHDETIVLEPTKIKHGIGPKARLERVELIIKVAPNGFIFVDSDFIDCRIVAKRQLTNCRWLGVRFKNCTFHGRYRGNDFGHWKTVGPETMHFGSIEDCDFADATLDGMRFINVDIPRIKLPRWPHFTVLKPHRLQKYLGRGDWPGRTDFWVSLWAEEHREVSAITLFAPAIMKHKCRCSEAELRDMINIIGEVVY